MLAAGRYSVWFRTDDAEGMRVIELKAGRVTGGDTVLSYFGTYTQDGSHFSATMQTKRHSPGKVGLFAMDEFDLALEGTFKGNNASGVGRVKQVPDAKLEVTLVRMND